MHDATKILHIERNIPWMAQPNEVQIALSSHLPPLELITTAFVLAFAGDRILMTNLTHRGWEIPGGHMEPGEQPEETARRETLEETQTTPGPLHLLGYQHLRLSGPKPMSYRYPYPDSYQVFYWAYIAAFSDFLPTAETQGRALFSPLEARNLAWVQHNRELYEAALLRAQHYPS